MLHDPRPPVRNTLGHAAVVDQLTRHEGEDTVQLRRLLGQWLSCRCPSHEGASGPPEPASPAIWKPIGYEATLVHDAAHRTVRCGTDRTLAVPARAMMGEGQRPAGRQRRTGRDQDQGSEQATTGLLS